MAEGLGVLAWLGGQTPSQGLPTRVAVDTSDRYLLGLLARHFTARMKRPVRIHEWTKARDSEIRAAIEETPLFGLKPLFLVLGAPKGWVRTLEPSRGCFVLAQQPGARLQGEPYHVREKSLVLRVLTRVLDLPWTMRELERVDWGWVRSWAEFEPLLARGKLLDWTGSELMRAAASRAPGDIFGLMRDGEWWAIHFLGKRYGRDWLYRHLIEFTVQVAQAQQILAAGGGLRRLKDSLGLTEFQADQVHEAARRVKPADLQYMCNRIVRLDPLVQRSPQGLDLLMMGAKI